MTATNTVPLSLKVFNFPRSSRRRIPTAVSKLGLLALLLALAESSAFADDTWTYSVEISATVQASPPQITLHWEADDIYGVTNYTIYRKSKSATSWSFQTS